MFKTTISTTKVILTDKDIKEIVADHLVKNNILSKVEASQIYFAYPSTDSHETSEYIQPSDFSIHVIQSESE